MSRSRKGGKGPGYDYWSRRNYKNLTSPSSDNKKITRRAERHKSKQSLGHEA